jgi:hypothetical protein
MGVATLPVLADSSLINLIIVAVATTGGIFLAVVLGGLLSALVTLGALEVGLRSIIQKNALANFFVMPDLESDLKRSPLYAFLLKRYSSDELASKYAQLFLNLVKQDRLVPILAQMDAGSLYRLHYRQICGQLMGVVNNEAMQREREHPFTPLTDVLVFLSNRRNEILRGPFAGRVNIVQASDTRSDLDLALREIDGIQATLGNSISKATFPFVLGAWTVLYVPALIASVIYLPFSSSGAVIAVAVAVIQHLFVILVAALGARALSTGSAVFGAVAFTWLDRVLASK